MSKWVTFRKRWILLLLAVNFFVSIFGVTIHIHTCSASGHHEVSLLSIKPCCGERGMSKNDGCCHVGAEYQKVESLPRIAKELTLVFCWTLTPWVVPTADFHSINQTDLHPRFNFFHPPPESGSEKLVRLGIARC